MAASVREAFEKGTAAFNAHDREGFAEVLSDDVVFHASGGLHGKGRKACAESYAAWFSAFPDAHVEMRAVHVVGDVVVEEGTFSGTHKGVLHSPAGDIPPTGRRVRADYINVLRFKDGKHVAMNLMYDRLDMLEQLGLAPAPGKPG
jgi:uncharacterized protein (TIGR02246 family)